MTQALLAAIRAGDVEAARREATAAALQSRGEDGATPLMLAAGRGDAAMVATLVAAGADVNAADERGFTALYYGSYNAEEDRGYPDVVQALIAAGADREAKIGYGVRPLMYAAGNGEAGVVEVLLRAGADPLARNDGGRTALMMVKDRDYVDVINLLHEAEAMLEVANCGSRNAPSMQVVTFLKREPGA